MSQQARFAGSARVPASRQSGYTGWRRARLRRVDTRRAGALACIIFFALTSGGCSFSYKLAGLFGDKEDETAGVTPSALARAEPAGPRAALPDEADLHIAKAAAAEALARGGKDVSVPWENPRSGARGTVTPIALASTRDGVVCRDFLASFVRGNDEAWLQGEGCRIQKGRWEVRAMKPLKP
jgi:surface antigen